MLDPVPIAAAMVVNVHEGCRIVLLQPPHRAHRQSAAHRTIMILIRRTPTMIPMTDCDVQDMRDMVAKQKVEAQKSYLLMLKLKRMS